MIIKYDSFITTLFNNKPTHDSAHLLGSTYSNWYWVNKQWSNTQYQHFSIMCVCIFILVKQIHYLWWIENSCEERHWHLDRSKAPLVYILPCILDLLLKFVMYLFFWDTILLHVAINAWDKMLSLLLKLQQINSEIHKYHSL